MGLYVSLENYDCSLHGFQPDAICEWQTEESEKTSSGYSAYDPCRKICEVSSDDFHGSICSADFLTYVAALVLLVVEGAKQKAQIAEYEKSLPVFLEAEAELTRFIESNWDSMEGSFKRGGSESTLRLGDEYMLMLERAEGHLKELQNKYWDVADLRFRTGMFYLRMSHCFTHYGNATVAVSYSSIARRSFSSAIQINKTLMLESLEKLRIPEAFYYANEARERLFSEIDAYERYKSKELRSSFNEEFDELIRLFNILNERAVRMRDFELIGYSHAAIGDIHRRRMETEQFFSPNQAKNPTYGLSRVLALTSYYQAARFLRDAASVVKDVETRDRLSVDEARQRLNIVKIRLSIKDFNGALEEAGLAAQVVDDYFTFGREAEILPDPADLAIRQKKEAPFYRINAEAKTVIAEIAAISGDADAAKFIREATTAIFEAVENKSFVKGEVIFDDLDLSKFRRLLASLAKLQAPANQRLMMITWINGRLTKHDGSSDVNYRYPYLALDPRVTEIRSASERGGINNEHIVMLADVLHRYESDNISVDQLLHRIAFGESHMTDLLEHIRLPRRVIEHLASFA